jgi:hypothetical protein
MGRVAHDAHDANRKQHQRPHYAGAFAMLFLRGFVGIVGKTVFSPCETAFPPAHVVPTMPTIQLRVKPLRFMFACQHGVQRLHARERCRPVVARVPLIG